MQATVEIESEPCCDECGDIIHNHFDCPACGQQFASTSIYKAWWEEDKPVIFSCEDCGMEFTTLDDSDYPDVVVEWQREWPL
jgi:transcription elongation factor Elf1